MDTKLKQPLELIPSRIGPPRFDKYSRMLARFYEPLFMLRALGQTRGAHTRQPHNINVISEKRRRFLENLCFVCDFTKGGESCTAIGLEDCVDKYQFWVSSNGDNPRIVIFLQEALKFLHRISYLTEIELVTANNVFTHFCADFAKSLIEAERKVVHEQAQICVSKLQNWMAKADDFNGIFIYDMIESHRTDLDDLVLVLKYIINQKDLVRLCDFVYEHRQSTWMTTLKSLALEDERELSPDAKRSSFFLLRHYIGRLCHHIRAPKQLVEDSFNMQHVLQTYTVMIIGPLAGVQLPLRDRHTNLKGIMNRMFKTDDVEKERVQEGLMTLHKVSGVFDKFLAFYKQSGSYVHAEIRVLEHFYRSQLVFAGNDRFIACSKPACLCCELYFKHHPARMVVPSSHRKVWTNWSPPNIQDSAANEDMVTQQKRIMSKITHDVREQVIDQVLQRTSQSLWHPDSKTCITESQAMSLQGLSLSEASEIDSGSDSMDNPENEMWSDFEDGGVPLLA